MEERKLDNCSSSDKQIPMIYTQRNNFISRLQGNTLDIEKKKLEQLMKERIVNHCNSCDIFKPMKYIQWNKLVTPWKYLGYMENEKKVRIVDERKKY